MSLIRLVVLLALGVLAALALRALVGHRAGVSSGATLAAGIERISALAELRLLRTELSSFQEASSPDSTSRVKAVIPVTMVLGVDLRQVRVLPAGDDVVVVVPPVRVLDRSTDHRRWLIWEERGGEHGAELERLLTAQAIHAAEEDVQRLGLLATAQRDAEAAVRELAQSIGFGTGTLKVVSRGR